MHQNIKLLTWFNFFTDFRFYAPIAIIYFAQVSGSYALGMLVFSIAQLSSASFEIPTGIFSDRIGRKKTAILGAVASTIAVFCYSLGFFYGILLLGAVFEGLSRSLYSGNNEALLHDSLHETGNRDEYAKYHGRVSGMFQIALGVSALIGGFLAYFSMQLVFLLSVIPQIICIFIGLKLIEPKISSKESGNIYSHLKEAIELTLKNPKLRLLSFSSIWAYGIGESGWLFRSAFISGVWPIWAVGIPQLLSNFGAAAGFFVAGKTIKKFGAPAVLFSGSIINSLLNIIALVKISLFSPILLVLTSPVFGLSMTAKSALFQKEFSNEQRATMGSLNSLLSSLFFAVVAYLVGLFADQFAPAQALLVLQIFMLVNLLVYWKLLKYRI